MAHPNGPIGILLPQKTHQAPKEIQIPPSDKPSVALFTSCSQRFFSIGEAFWAGSFPKKRRGWVGVYYKIRVIRKKADTPKNGWLEDEPFFLKWSLWSFFR